MTIVIAYTNGNHDYIASDVMGSNGLRGLNYENNKIFKKDEVLIGGAGSYRHIQLIEYGFDSPHQSETDIDYYMQYTFANAFIDFLDQHDALSAEHSNEETEFIFICKHRIYVMQSDLAMLSINGNFAAIGEGADFAYGFLTAQTRGEQHIYPTELMNLTVATTSDYCLSVGKEFKMLSA